MVNFIADNTAGSELVDAYMRPVRNIEGNVVLCEGGWNDPKNSEQLQSAISALHQQFGIRLRQMRTMSLKSNQLNQDMKPLTRKSAISASRFLIWPEMQGTNLAGVSSNIKVVILTSEGDGNAIAAIRPAALNGGMQWLF